jgi:hypothetical protein
MLFWREQARPPAPGQTRLQGDAMSNLDEPDRRWRNLSGMLDRLGLNAEMLAHGRLAVALRAAVSTCQSCDTDQLCQGWLARAPEWLDAAPAFCPNRRLFACERGMAHGDIQGSEQLELDANALAKVIDDLCSDFGRSDAVRCEGGR